MESNETFVRLPLEILELIIDNLGHDSEPSAYSALKSVSTTCHTLLPICRKYLFANVEIREPRSCAHNMQPLLCDLHARGLFELISSTSSIANSITKLSIDCRFASATYLRTNLYESFYQAIKCINRLESLHLTVVNSWLTCQYDPALLPALTHLFGLTSLTDLHLTGIDGIPPLVVAMWQGIRRLYIHMRPDLEESSILNLSSVDPDAYPLLHPISLQLLSIKPFKFHQLQELFTLRLPNGLPAIDFASLTSLEIYDMRHAQEVLPHLLNYGARNIKRILFQRLTYNVIGLSDVLWPMLPTLKHINLQYPRLGDIYRLYRELVNLSKDSEIKFMYFSQSSPIENQVESIVINFSITDLDPPSSIFEYIAELLSDRTAWPTLKLVDLSVEPYRGDGTVNGVVLDSAMEAKWRSLPDPGGYLESLADAGILRYRFAYKP